MSMRLGTSRTFSSFENVLRLRGAVVLAGKASPPAGLVGELRSVVPDQGATVKVSSEGPCPQRTGERAACGPNFPSRSGAISGHYTAGLPQVKATACGTSRATRERAGQLRRLGGRRGRTSGDVQRVVARGEVARSRGRPAAAPRSRRSRSRTGSGGGSGSRDGGLIGLGTSPSSTIRSRLAESVRVGHRHRREQRLGVGVHRAAGRAPRPARSRRSCRGT